MFKKLLLSIAFLALPLQICSSDEIIQMINIVVSPAIIVGVAVATTIAHNKGELIAETNRPLSIAMGIASGAVLACLIHSKSDQGYRIEEFIKNAGLICLGMPVVGFAAGLLTPLSPEERKIETRHR